MIGSGLRSNWQAGQSDLGERSDPSVPNHRERRLGQEDFAGEINEVGSRDSSSIAAFLSRPRLQEIGAGEGPPLSGTQADDGNWVSGSMRIVQAESDGFDPAVRQASGRSGMPTHVLSLPGRNHFSSLGRDSAANHGLMPAAAPMLSALRTVSSESIEAIEAETRGVSVERLQLIFSRLVADRVSASEVEPVLRAARHLESASGDEMERGRAKLLAERAEQYRRIADRRDGETVIRTASAPTLPNRNEPSRDNGLRTENAHRPVVQAVMPDTATDPLVNSGGDVGAAQEFSETGTLIAVYSIRKQSPPFVLIDRSGQTLAYVTPAPGIDLRIHLNSRIRVTGRRSYLEGVNTPHLMASRVERTPES